MKLQPYVVIDRHQNTGIFLVRGHKRVTLVARDPHFRLMRVPLREFDEEYRPLTTYVNGKPSEVQYDLQAAARRYMEYSKNAGITEGALRCLQDIIRGGIDMTSVEEATTKEGDKPVPKMAQLGDALNGATAPKKTPRASTKNGTTKEARKPGKAKVVQGDNGSGLEPAPNGSKSTKEQSMQAQTSTSKSSRKATPAVVRKSVSKTGKVAGSTKATKKQAAAAETTQRGRPSKIDGSLKIKILCQGNPRREGSKGFENWAIVKRYDGKTVEAYLKAGGLGDKLTTDIKRGNVKLVK